MRIGENRNRKVIVAENRHLSQTHRNQRPIMTTPLPGPKCAYQDICIHNAHRNFLVACARACVRACNVGAVYWDAREKGREKEREMENERERERKT